MEAVFGNGQRAVGEVHAGQQLFDIEVHQRALRGTVDFGQGVGRGVGGRAQHAAHRLHVRTVIWHVFGGLPWHALGFITRRDDVTASAAHLLKRLLEVALLDGLLRLADYPLRRLPEQPAGNARRQQSRDQYRENYGADMFALSHRTNVPFVPSSAIVFWPLVHQSVQQTCLL